MKLRLLLWLMALRFRRAIRRNASFRDYLQGNDRTIQFTTEQQRVARYLDFRDQTLRSRARELDQADVTLRFASAGIGFRTLWTMATGKDKNAVMRAIQDKELTVEGDPMVLMWFQKSVKYLR